MSKNPFTPCKRGDTCEIHLLVESRRQMFPTSWGYCGRKARWWYESVTLCDMHKRILDRYLKGRDEHDTSGH